MRSRAVLARDKVEEPLGDPELQDEVGRRDDEPHLLVGPELRLRQQPRQDQRQRDAERGRAAAAEHQRACLPEDAIRLYHPGYPCAESPCPDPGLPEVPKLVGRAPITGRCSASMPRVFSNWQAISGFE